MRQRLPFLLFLLLYWVFAFSTYKDFGPTWDEQDTYQEGANLYDYFVHHKILQYVDPEHSYPYAFLLHPFAAPDQYETFHLLNLLAESFLFWAIFEVLLAFCRSAWWALAGPAFLFLYLPFLGSIPANPKDIPFALFYFLSLVTIALWDRVFPNGRFRWLILGVLFGLTIASRVLGFTLFPLLALYDVALWRMESDANTLFGKWIAKKLFGWMGTLVLSQFICVLVWPFLGMDYWQNLPVVLTLSARFPPKFTFLFMGGMADSLTYPWFYLPLLISLMTPLFILAFFGGALAQIRRLIQEPLYLLVLAALVLNLGLYFLLHPAIYDGLRHFLFLLPLIAVISAMGFIGFFKGKRWDLWRKGAMGLTLFSVLMTLVQLVRLHPYEYVYFNELAGGFPGAYGRYETDYWAASIKEAVQWLKANEIKDPTKPVMVYSDGNPYQAKAYFEGKMYFEPRKSEADYAIIMTRAGFKPDALELPKVIHRVEREGTPLSFVVKLK
jgi:hypothetical protein